MKKTAIYFLFFLSIFYSYTLKSQAVSAPDLRCVSVITPTSVAITWVIPPDPSGIFTSYQIWSSPIQTGSYSIIGTVNSYSQNTFIDNTLSANNQSIYYYVVTISNGGSSVSLPSDTLRSVYLNLNNSNGVISLAWNATKVPLLPSASKTYTLSREYPTGTWTTIYTGINQNYKDTIYHCKIFYNYKVVTSDSYGCNSFSNIKGDTCYNGVDPLIPTLDSISINSNGQAVLGWQPSRSLDVDHYEIYSASGTFLTPIGTNTGYNNTSFTYTNSNAGNTSESYCIVAVDSCGLKSVPSIISTSIFLNTSFDLCSRTASLSWNDYKNLPQGVASYVVYCSVNMAPLTILGTTAGTSFTHAQLNAGDTYCYFIRVVNTPKNITAISNVSCLLAKAPQAPAYVYINSVSVNTLSKKVEITYSVDNTRSFKGATIFKSLDGITFNQLVFNIATSNSVQTYTDNDVTTSEKKYYYKIQITDSCGNPGSYSNVSKTIVLQVSNNRENIFYNTLTWDDYTSWSGGVASFNIYRAINGVFDPTPVTNVPVGTKTYIDNVQDFVSDQGKFSYYVEAVEGAGNIYGFMDAAKSNPADAYVEVNVFVPNAFAPKGKNNTWLPIAQYVEKTDYKVMVFNRFGTKIFETNSDTEAWTGDAATDDVYVYLIEYKNARGEFVQLKGHLTIIR